jgi:hypothetical protein
MKDLKEVLDSGRKLLFPFHSYSKRSKNPCLGNLVNDTKCKKRNEYLYNSILNEFGTEFSRYTKNFSQSQLISSVEPTTMPPGAVAISGRGGIWKKRYKTLAVLEIISKVHLIIIHVTHPSLNCHTTLTPLSSRRVVQSVIGFQGLRAIKRVRKLLEAGFWKLHTDLLDQYLIVLETNEVGMRKRNGEAVNPYFHRYNVKPIAISSQISLPFYLLLGLMGFICFTVFILEITAISISKLCSKSSVLPVSQVVLDGVNAELQGTF